MNYKDIVFKECAVHNMIRYAGDKCPVCERDILITAAEEEKIQLENQITELERKHKIGAWGFKDGEEYPL